LYKNPLNAILPSTTTSLKLGIFVKIFTPPNFTRKSLLQRIYGNIIGRPTFIFTVHDLKILQHTTDYNRRLMHLTAAGQVKQKQQGQYLNSRTAGKSTAARPVTQQQGEELNSSRASNSTAAGPLNQQQQDH
jgi:hypothetical protein